MKKIIYVLIICCPCYAFAQHNKWVYTGSAALNSIAGKEVDKFQITGTCNMIKYSRWVHGYYNNVNNSYAVSGHTITCNYDIGAPEYEYDAYSNTKITVTASNIPADATVEFTTTYNGRTEVDIDGFNPLDLFPPPVAGVSMEYLQPSDSIQSDNASIKSKAEELTANCTLMAEAVEAIATWIDGNIVYRLPGKQDAVSVFTTLHPDRTKGGVGSGSCQGFTNLMIAMLRSVDIPARCVGGRNVKASYSMPSEYGPLTPGVNDGLHALYEVYYPTLGWVNGDPQSNLHFKTQNFCLFSISPGPEGYEPIKIQYSGGTLQKLGQDVQTTNGNTDNNYVYKDFSSFTGTVARQQNMLAVYVGGEIVQGDDIWDSPDAYGSVEVSGGTTITITFQISARNYTVLNNGTLIIDAGRLNIDPGFSLSIESGGKLIIRNNGILSIAGGSVDMKQGAEFQFYNGGGVLN